MALGTTTRRAGPSFRFTATDNGSIIEIGPPVTQGVGTIMLQFSPSMDWNGQLTVMGKILGQDAQAKGAPFVPVPYRSVDQGNFAAAYDMISNAIADTGIIQVPANGLSIGFLVACSAGFMDVFVYRLDGSSAV